MEPCHPSEIRAGNVTPSAFELLERSPGLADLVKIIRRAGPSDAPVLIVGESGTGKELVAHAIHEQSHRRGGPLVCVNLAAVPSELSETVLFGHERGAFTGALRASRGFCRAAEKGTLFLDEIGESSVSLQAKLLRFLQSAEVQPVGSEEVTVVDARIVTATNRDLAAAIRDKQFREDLFYRLNIVQIRVPPLRERRDDISPLIDLFLEELNARYARCCRITDSAAELLKSFAWPGNVRQLRGVIETLVVLAESDAIGVSDLPVELRVEAGDHSPEEVTPPLEPATVLERMTTLMIRDMLEQERGNVSRAAHRLGISRATLYRRLKKVRRHGNAD